MRPLNRRQRTLLLLFLTLAALLAVTLAGALLTQRAMETDFSATAVVSVLILGVFQVALAYILLTIGLKTTPPVTASLVSGIEPVLNPILVAVFYHEMIGPTALVGAVIVVGSVVAYNVICGRREHKERVPAQGEKQQSC